MLSGLPGNEVEPKGSATFPPALDSQNVGSYGAGWGGGGCSQPLNVT
jgi:hypothetical protein